MPTKFPRRRTPAATRDNNIASPKSNPTPLRRSPRFHPQDNHGNNTGLPSSGKNQVFPASTSKSPIRDCSRSGREKPVKCLVGPPQTPRRSARLSTAYFDETKTAHLVISAKATSESKVSGREHTAKCPVGPPQTPRRSARLLTAFLNGGNKTHVMIFEKCSGESNSRCRENAGKCLVAPPRRSLRFSNLNGDLGNVVSPVGSLKGESQSGVRRSSRSVGSRSTVSEKEDVGNGSNKFDPLAISREADTRKILKRSGRVTISEKEAVGRNGLKGLEGSNERQKEKNNICRTRTSPRKVEGRKRRKVERVDIKEIELMAAGEANGVLSTSDDSSGRKIFSSSATLVHRKRGKNTGSVVVSADAEETEPLDSVNGPIKLENGRSVLEELEGNLLQGRRKGTTVVPMQKEGCEEKRNDQSKVKGVGIDRKVDVGCDLLEWTSEQVKALHRAYLKARPSPHFWKKVSKMVPGKSAKECFDRIHSHHVTPPLPLPRSRMNRSTMSPLSHFSLLDSKPSEFFNKNVKKVRSNKQRRLLAQKTVRHILRKHCMADQSQEADMFSLFETSSNSSANDILQVAVSLSPDRALDSPRPVQANSENLPTVHKTMLTRFITPVKENNPSPEVLKQVKNMALHEKYIDQLHDRHAKQRVSSKAASLITGRDDEENMVPKTAIVKAAKNALLSEAREVICQFQHMKASSSSNYADFDDSDSDGSNISESEGTPA